MSRWRRALKRCSPKLVDVSASQTSTGDQELEDCKDDSALQNKSKRQACRKINKEWVLAYCCAIP